MMFGSGRTKLQVILAAAKHADQGDQRVGRSRRRLVPRRGGGGLQIRKTTISWEVAEGVVSCDLIPLLLCFCNNRCRTFAA